jgi:hypothetical protein
VLVTLFLVGCGKEPLAGQAVGKYDGGKDITKESDKIPGKCLKLSS